MYNVLNLMLDKRWIHSNIKSNDGVGSAKCKFGMLLTGHREKTNSDITLILIFFFIQSVIIVERTISYIKNEK